MRTAVFGIILSLIFSSLPAKVWACGLGLCPMEHHQEKTPKSKHSCHQEKPDESSENTSVTRVESKSGIKATQGCPCPDTFIEVSLLPETRYSLNSSKTNIQKWNETFGAVHSIGTQRIAFVYRPPPIGSSLRLHLFHQVLVI